MKRCAKASTFSSFLKEQGRQLGRSGSPTVSPGTGCPKGRWTAVPEDSGCPEGPGAGRLRAGAGSPSLGGGGGWALELRGSQSAPGRAESRLSPRGCVEGSARFGAASLYFAVVCKQPGREFQTFPPRPARAGHCWALLPCLVGSGQGPGAGPGACLPLCPPRAVRGTCVLARGARPPPAPFPAAVNR